MIRLTKSDFRILRALPRSLNYSEISRKAGFSQPYVSGRIRNMRTKFDFVFRVDFWSMSLQPLLIISEYSETFVARAKKEGFQYVYTVEVAYKSLEKLLLVDILAPRDEADEIVESLGLKVREVLRKRYEVMWRPDKSDLVELVDGKLVVRIDKLSEVYEKCEEYREAERRVVQADKIDMLILWKKMEHPFLPLASIGRKLGISQQLVSYHFRHHVLGQWIYNGVRVKAYEKIAPTFLVKVDVSSSSAALRLLELAMKIPYVQKAFTTYDNPKSVYVFFAAPCDKYKELLSRAAEIGDLTGLSIVALVDTESRIKGKYPWGNAEIPPPGFLTKRRVRRERVRASGKKGLNEL